MIIIFFAFVNTFRTLSQLFGVLEYTFLKCTHAVMDALIANLHQIMRLPKAYEFQQFAYEFYKVGLFFPNVIGPCNGLYLEMELT